VRYYHIFREDPTSFCASGVFVFFTERQKAQKAQQIRKIKSVTQNSAEVKNLRRPGFLIRKINQVGKSLQLDAVKVSCAL